VLKNIFLRYDLKIRSRVEVELFLGCVGDQGAKLCQKLGQYQVAV